MRRMGIASCIPLREMNKMLNNLQKLGAIMAVAGVYIYASNSIFYLMDSESLRWLSQTLIALMMICLGVVIAKLYLRAE